MKALSIATLQAVAFLLLFVVFPPAGLLLILRELGRVSGQSRGYPGRRFPFVARGPGGSL